MAGHFPFSGKTNRVSVYAFFEAHNWGYPVQEKYYKRWYDWAKNYVMNNPDLKAAKGPLFNHYPYGEHAFHNFHLHDYAWCNTLLELGDFIKGNIFPTMSADGLHKLEEEHHHWLEEMDKEAETSPRGAPPEIGRYRHV